MSPISSYIQVFLLACSSVAHPTNIASDVCYDCEQSDAGPFHATSPATLLAQSHQFMQEHNSTTMIAYLNENNDTQQTRSYIHKYYLDTFNLYFSLYDNIREEYFWDSGCKLRWPVGWYLGHAASFYNNKLKMNNYLTRNDPNHIYSQYDHLFAQGTDEMDWTDFVPQFPKSYWPSVENVKMYCKDTKDFIIDIILTAPLNSLPITKSTIWWTILMGIEHERIHLETSAMLIRQLPLHKCKENINEIWSNEYPLSDSGNMAPMNELISVKGKEIRYGRASQLLNSSNINDFFGWDAEYGQYTVNVSSFNASKYMVSNMEFYEFYNDNGYHNSEYWSEMGWKWVTETNTTHPRFWVIKNGTDTIKLRNIFSEIDLFSAWNRPVICNHYESDAFIKWKSERLNVSLRLISEDEWYVLRTLDDSIGHQNIREMDSVNVGNINFQYFSSESPVDLFKFGTTQFYDVIGNVHHNTLSNYHPFHNYEIDPLYVDFSSPFFNHSYFLMKGGSYLSSGNMAMIYNRCQWFREHYFQASGIRYVQSQTEMSDINNDKMTTKEYFENSDQSNELCNECIHFQFSQNYYRQIVSEIINEIINENVSGNDSMRGNDGMRVLDIGCSVGGVAYELAKNLDCVNDIIGIDDRARFIGIANQIQQNRKLEYFIENQAMSVSLNELGMENVTNKIRFIHDSDLNVDFGNEKFDLIIGENMFERYYDRLVSEDNGLKLSNILSENGTIILFEDYEKWNRNDVADVMNEINAVLGSGLTLTKAFDTKPIMRQNYESSRIQQPYQLHCTIWN